MKDKEKKPARNPNPQLTDEEVLLRNEKGKPVEIIPLDVGEEGDETVGGMTPTPDQDVVEGLGEALGITFDDDEPLQTGDKLEERDGQRWELDRDSAADVEDD